MATFTSRAESTAMRKPELTTTSHKIDKLISRIKDGDIRVPAFQRGYVWKQDQIIALLQSIVSDFPIGSILLWEASESEKLKFTRNIAGYMIPDKPESYPVNYVLDGQQRLSSIYAVFSECTHQDETSRQYNPNLDIFEIYYDFADSQFKAKKDCDPAAAHVVYLRHLLDPLRLFDELARLDKSHHIQAKELSSKFLNYDVPVVTIKNRSRTDVGIIFERINNMGTKLDIVDLMTAWTWTEDFHLLESANELTEALEDKGFGIISHRLLLQIVSGLLLGSTTTENILKLQGTDVRDKWGDICESVKQAIDFLSTNLNCFHSDFLPYNQQLVAITTFFFLCTNHQNKTLEQLTRWFWITSFSDRYSTGQTTTKMDTDISAMKAIAAGDFTVMDKYNYTVTPTELIGSQFSKTNPLTRAFLLLMAQRRPRDLIKNTAIDLAESLSSFNRKQYHHVFPDSFLKKAGVNKNKRYSLVNFCFLPSDSNKKISSKNPSTYFNTLVPTEAFREILESNLLPTKKEIYQNDEFDEFLSRRAELIMSEINRIT